MKPYYPKKEIIETSYLMQEYNNLISCNTLGLYNCCDTVSIFLIEKKTRTVHNIYTIFALDEKTDVCECNRYLTEKPIPITDTYSLGISSKIEHIYGIKTVYNKLCENRDKRVVDIGDGELRIGELESLPKIFVQEDGTQKILMNRVLTNKCLNGSYILEFFDIDKFVLQTLNDKQFKILTDEIYKITSIDLFSVSDRVGNFVFQFPSINTSVSCEVVEEEKFLDYYVSIDSRVENDCQLQLQSEIIYDNNIIGFGVTRCSAENKEISFKMGNTAHMCRSTLIDLTHQLILSRKDFTFIRKISFAISCHSGYGKSRQIYDTNGNIQYTIETESVSNHSIYAPIIREREKYIDGRQYNKRIEDLYEHREFRSYGMNNDEYEKERATRDLISLMNTIIVGKVYLWDPYLSAEDLLNTWYHTKTNMILMKAITSRATATDTLKKWIDDQKNILNTRSNNYGIKLEWRCQCENYGYSFHDRFLMVLNEGEPPKVWSLGSSINGLGMKHHVIQSVGNSQMLVDAFDDLWNKLNHDDCLIWRKGF